MPLMIPEMHATLMLACDIEFIIITITLFQKDNIFDMNASLTYGPQ